MGFGVGDPGSQQALHLPDLYGPLVRVKTATELPEETT